MQGDEVMTSGGSSLHVSSSILRPLQRSLASRAMSSAEGLGESSDQRAFITSGTRASV